MSPAIRARFSLLARRPPTAARAVRLVSQARVAGFAMAVLFALAGSAGCAGTSPLRSRAVPQLVVTARRTFGPAAFAVDARASFFTDAPAPSSIAPLASLPLSPPVAGFYSGLVGGLPSTRGAADRSLDPQVRALLAADHAAQLSFEPDGERLLRASPEVGLPCGRADTCAWARVRVARLLAAWGVGP